MAASITNSNKSPNTFASGGTSTPFSFVHVEDPLISGPHGLAGGGGGWVTVTLHSASGPLGTVADPGLPFYPPTVSYDATTNSSPWTRRTFGGPHPGGTHAYPYQVLDRMTYTAPTLADGVPEIVPATVSYTGSAYLTPADTTPSRVTVTLADPMVFNVLGAPLPDEVPPPVVIVPTPEPTIPPVIAQPTPTVPTEPVVKVPPTPTPTVPAEPVVTAPPSPTPAPPSPTPALPTEPVVAQPTPTPTPTLPTEPSSPVVVAQPTPVEPGPAPQSTPTPQPTPTTVTAVPPVTPPVAMPVNFGVVNISTGTIAGMTGQDYTGPQGVKHLLFLAPTTDSLAVASYVPSVFVKTGSGNDAVNTWGGSGTNVLDGGEGSNFLVGGTGKDTFFVDARNAAGPTWSTVRNLQAGDAATLWGVTAKDFALSWVDDQGAADAKGLTLHATAAGKQTASLTLSGYGTNDLSNGRLALNFGQNDAGSYLYVVAL